MPNAGYCKSCASNVWLTPEGTCPEGHPATDIEGTYEAALPDAPVAVAAQGRSKRKWWIVAVVAAILVIIGSCVSTAALLTPAVEDATEISAEWQETLASDYPGWDVVGWHWSGFTGTNGASSDTYTFAVVPPDRDWAVPVVYESVNEGSFKSRDMVLRKASAWTERSEALLDYLETNYVDQDRSMTAVTCEDDGSVTVEWQTVSRVLFFTSTVGSFDEITWDADSQTYVHSWSP